MHLLKNSVESRHGGNSFLRGETTDAEDLSHENIRKFQCIQVIHVARPGKSLPVLLQIHHYLTSKLVNMPAVNVLLHIIHKISSGILTYLRHLHDLCIRSIQYLVFIGKACSRVYYNYTEFDVAIPNLIYDAVCVNISS